MSSPVKECCCFFVNERMLFSCRYINLLVEKGMSGKCNFGISVDHDIDIVYDIPSVPKTYLF